MIKKILELVKKYREVILYLFFGGLTTIVNFVAYIILAKGIRIEENISNICAIIISILFAYITNKIFVFNSKTDTIKKFIKEITMFFSCRAFSAIADVALFFIMVNIFRINDMIAKLVIQVIVTILNYLFSKLLIFKKKEV